MRAKNDTLPVVRPTLFLVPLAVLVAPLVAARARADLGPPPSCEAGKHQQYLYGHKCVADGYHLTAGPNGEVLTVKDGSDAPTKPTASTSTTSSVTASATTAPTTTATPSPTPKTVATSTSVPAPAPEKKEDKGGCVYAPISSAGGAGLPGSALFAAAAFVVARRRRLTACRTSRG